MAISQNCVTVESLEFTLYALEEMAINTRVIYIYISICFNKRVKKNNKKPIDLLAVFIREYCWIIKRWGV